MIPGIGSMGGEGLPILLAIVILLFFGAEPFGIGVKELREDAARLGDEDETKRRPHNDEAGKEIAPNAGKGGRSV